MAEALLKTKNNLPYPCTTGDTDGSLLTPLLEALTAGAQLNVGQKGRTTHSPSNYSLGSGQIVDSHLAGIDTAIGGKASTSHKDTHKSEQSDAFASTDLLEAVVKRLQVTGPTTLLVGAIADGKFLKRSGTGIVGDDPPSMSTHALGGSYHSTDSLANLNARVTGGDLDFDTASRPPSGAAGGALFGTYPNPDLGAGQVSATASYLCNSTTYEDITTMSITPVAGMYLVWYNCTAFKGDTESNGFCALHVDTTIDADSERQFSLHMEYVSFGTQGLLTVNGSQAIKARARVVNAGTSWTHYRRSLQIIRVTD